MILKRFIFAHFFCILINCTNIFAQTNPLDSSGFVVISNVIPNSIIELRYYSTYNFVGDRIDGYKEPYALLTKEASLALKKVSDELFLKGYLIKIFDAYRPHSAVQHFIRWSKKLDDIRMKEYFYPTVDKSLLYKKGYIAYKSGHSRGSTIDLTLFDMRLGKDVDMGSAFDYFGEISHFKYTKGLTKQQIENRLLLHNVMIKHGFRGLSEEWWHFTLDNEPFPNTYFNFPITNINR